MSLVIAILVGAVILALAIQFLWNAIEIAYRVVMLVFYSIAYVAVSIYEGLSFIVRWTLIYPIRGLYRLASGK